MPESEWVSSRQSHEMVRKRQGPKPRSETVGKGLDLISLSSLGDRGVGQDGLVSTRFVSTTDMHAGDDCGFWIPSLLRYVPYGAGREIGDILRREGQLLV